MDKKPTAADLLSDILAQRLAKDPALAAKQRRLLEKLGAPASPAVPSMTDQEIGEALGHAPPPSR
jgi:hypothetical protein